MEAKQSGHQKYRLKLVRQLLDAASKAAKYNSHHQRLVKDLKVQNGVMHVQGMLYEHNKPRPCVMRQIRGRRGPLQAVNPNQASARRPLTTRTTQGYIQCNVSLCNDCCKEHLEAANSAVGTDSDSVIE